MGEAGRTTGEPYRRSDWNAPSTDSSARLPPDPGRDPEPLVVPMDTGVRIHYLDWGGPEGTPGPPAPAGRPASAGPVDPAPSTLPPLVLLHGVEDTAWAWAPVARRLCGATRVLAIDQRGHGLSDAPRDGYALDSLAMDVLTVLVANGWGPDAGGPPVVIAGHGFGGSVAVAVAAARPGAVCGLGLIDGGWEDVGRSVGDDPEQAVKSLAEPPEVLRSMDAWLADRRAFDPASWDADQERAARARVEEKHAGHVVPVTGRAALLATVTAMLSHRPGDVLPLVRAPTLVAVAGASAPDDETARDREAELTEALGLIPAPVRLVRFPGSGHNLMRYVPDSLAAELAGLLRIAAASQE